MTGLSFILNLGKLCMPINGMKFAMNTMISTLYCEVGETRTGVETFTPQNQVIVHLGSS